MICYQVFKMLSFHDDDEDLTDDDDTSSDDDDDDGPGDNDPLGTDDNDSDKGESGLMLCRYIEINKFKNIPCAGLIFR